MRETWVRTPGEGKGYLLQYSGLENPMDSIIYGVTKSRTQLSDFHFSLLYSASPAMLVSRGWQSPLKFPPPTQCFWSLVQLSYSPYPCLTFPSLPKILYDEKMHPQSKGVSISPVTRWQLGFKGDTKYFWSFFFFNLFYWRIVNLASLVPQMVKNPPAMEEAWVRSLGQEDPLEKGMATHSTILAWRVPQTEEPGGL